MNKLTGIVTIFLLLAFTNQGGYSYKEILYEQTLVLTYDNNNGVLDWDKSGRRIAFESSFQGSKGVYFIDLFNLPINFAKNGFHAAKYINEMDDLGMIYVPVAVGKDTVFSEPKWDPRGMRILTIGKKQNYSEIYVTKRTTLKPIPSGIKNIVTAHWKNDSILYVVKNDQPKKLLEINRFTLKSKEVLTVEEPIIGISKQLNTLYLTFNGGTYEFDPIKEQLEVFYLPINGKTTGRLGRLNFVGLNKNGNAQVLDLNNAKSYPFSVGEKDGPPALSNDEKFVAYYSGYINGIVIKRIDKKFYLE